MALLPSVATAQQKVHVSFKSSAENAKFIQQVNVDVGDMPGHIVRVFDVHRTFPANQPVINGLKLTEESDRGDVDIVNGSGSGTLYAVYVMDNGDKFSARTTTLVEPGAGKLTATSVGVITGGTGKLAGIQGTVREVTTFDPKSGFNEAQTELDYSIGQ